MITTFFGKEVVPLDAAIQFEGRFEDYCQRVDLNVEVPDAVHALPALGQRVELRWSCPCGAAGFASARKLDGGGYLLSAIDLLHAPAL